MPSFKKFVNFLKNPGRLPTASIVEIQADGIIIDNKKIKFSDIKSVVYFSMHDEYQLIHAGRTGHVILTKNNEVMYAIASDEQLTEAFDSKLERWKGTNNKFLGEIIRWKQPNEEYQFVNDRDENSFNLRESLTNKIPKIFLLYAVIVFLLLLFMLFLAIIWPAVSRY